MITRFSGFIFLWCLFIISTSSITWSSIDGQVAVEAGGFVRALIPERFGIILGLAAVFLCSTAILPSIKKIDFILLLLLIWIFFVNLWSIDPVESFGRGVVLALTVVIPAIAVTSFGGEKIFQAFWYFSFSILLVSVAVSLSGSTYGVMGGAHEGLWRGVFVHKNHFGVFLAVFTVMTVLNAAWLKWQLRYFAAGLGLLAIVQCGSATAAILVILGSSHGYALQILRSRNVSRGLLSVGAGLVVVLACFVGWILSDQILDFFSRDLSFSGRTVLWSTTWDYARDYPFGQGYRMAGGQDYLAELYRNSGWNAPSTHNGFLSLILDIGYFGAAIWLVWLLFAIFGVFANLLSDLNYGVLLSSVSVVIFVNAQFDSSGGLYPGYTLSLLMLLYFITIPQSVNHKKGSEAELGLVKS